MNKEELQRIIDLMNKARNSLNTVNGHTQKVYCRLGISRVCLN